MRNIVLNESQERNTYTLQFIIRCRISRATEKADLRVRDWVHKDSIFLGVVEMF